MNNTGIPVEDIKPAPRSTLNERKEVKRYSPFLPSTPEDKTLEESDSLLNSILNLLDEVIITQYDAIRLMQTLKNQWAKPGVKLRRSQAQSPAVAHSYFRDLALIFRNILSNQQQYYSMLESKQTIKIRLLSQISYIFSKFSNQTSYLKFLSSTVIPQLKEGPINLELLSQVETHYLRVSELAPCLKKTTQTMTSIEKWHITSEEMPGRMPIEPSLDYSINQQYLNEQITLIYQTYVKMGIAETISKLERILLIDPPPVDIEKLLNQIWGLENHPESIENKKELVSPDPSIEDEDSLLVPTEICITVSEEKPLIKHSDQSTPSKPDNDDYIPETPSSLKREFSTTYSYSPTQTPESTNHQLSTDASTPHSSPSKQDKEADNSDDNGENKQDEQPIEITAAAAAADEDKHQRRSCCNRFFKRFSLTPQASTSNRSPTPRS